MFERSFDLLMKNSNLNLMEEYAEHIQAQCCEVITMMMYCMCSLLRRMFDLHVRTDVCSYLKSDYRFINN